ncbi:MAG: AAA family ATPase, partial [Dehalococcoidia bacterium]|nr:AAA family ATPase [Dehalococcoidia bacterium]
MVALYVTSMEAAGKTALCAGIGRKLLDRGLKIGFFMPVQISEKDSIDSNNEDTAFIKKILDLKESGEQLVPVRLSQSELWRSLTTEVADFTDNMRQIYRKISKGRDIVIMEGLGNLDVDKVSTLACY